MAPVLPPEARPQRRRGGHVIDRDRQGIGQMPIGALVPQKLAQDRMLAAMEQISACQGCLEAARVWFGWACQRGRNWGC